MIFSFTEPSYLNFQSLPATVVDTFRAHLSTMRGHIVLCRASTENCICLPGLSLYHLGRNSTPILQLTADRICILGNAFWTIRLLIVVLIKDPSLGEVIFGINDAGVF
jgi:hypothetical protein